MIIRDHDGRPQIVVRIAVMEGEEQVTFSAAGAFTVEDDCHTKKTLGKPGPAWTARVKGGQSARFRYWVRTDLLHDAEGAQRLLQARQAEEPASRMFEAGQKLEHDGAVVLDNREFWICTGPEETQEAAVRRAEKLLESNPAALVVPEMVGVPHGHVEVLDPDGVSLCLGRRVRVQAQDPDGVILHGIPVGRDFHWEHRERLSFRGTIEFMVGNDGKLLAVDELPMEEYLVSVNSSEMDARSPVEFLKAQTVAARATLLSTAGKHHRLEPFDLCNGDHCQCYYGVVREGRVSRQAVEQTRDEVLVSGDRICDARYSKVCGGIMEANEHVWPGEPISYMRSGVDAPSAEAAGDLYPADIEERARRWIESRPEAYCNPDADDLPDYMAYALKYFRWQVAYPRQELEEIIEKKSGRSVGTLQELRPLARGDSGRISRLAVVGTEGMIILEKELEIRRVLSSSHLYSSCFVVDYERDGAGEIAQVILSGAGWGHGAGLCQVGATMMAVRGQSYDQILAHYYQGSELKKIL
jgi:stage II sporulation protein D